MIAPGASLRATVAIEAIEAQRADRSILLAAVRKPAQRKQPLLEVFVPGQSGELFNWHSYVEKPLARFTPIALKVLLLGIDRERH